MRIRTLSNLTKGLILLVAILGIGGGLVFWKSKVGGHSLAAVNSISKEEIGILLADLGKTDPMGLKRLAEDPKLRKLQLDNLKQLLALASQARREGLNNEEPYRQELENIRNEIIAANYDREINKDKGPMPSYGFITEDQVKAFWGEGEQQPKGFFEGLKASIGLGKRDNELEFQRFVDTKIAILKQSSPQFKDREITDEERTQAREFFAKIQIYVDEFETKAAAGELPQEFLDKVFIQVKLQQAQFLARAISDKVAERNKVTDEEIDKYIAEHPEFDVAPKKAKAEEILKRALAGEDFAALANEFSEDPGNKAGGDKGNGGLYKDVTKGRMVAPFEEAALALEAGQIAPNLVETDFGFHIIKLERKGMGKTASGEPAETYDVRHILISTGYSDPENPYGRPVPIRTHVRQVLEQEKQKSSLDEMIARNKVEVPEDFDVPEVSDAEVKEALKKQRQQFGLPEDGEDGGELDDPHAAPPANDSKSENK